MGLLDQIANPQMADIAGALDYREARLARDEAKRKDIRLGQLVAESLPGIRPDSPLYEMAQNSPREFSVFAKSLGIPLNSAEQFGEVQTDVENLYMAAQMGGPQSVRDLAVKMKDERNAQGRETPVLDKAIAGFDADPQKMLTSLFVTHRSINGQDQTAGQREFASLTEGLSDEDKLNARKIELGLAPRAVGSGAITTATQGLTDKVAQSQGVIAGAKSGAAEEAKLDAQIEKMPVLKAAVKDAEAKIAELGEKRTEASKNVIVMNMYEAGLSGLVEGLEGTETGPIVGRLPAVTTGQQIADGAVSAMAPLLKALFRTAGEGTFTNQDQELLINMLPTRKDTPEARVAKIGNVDAIVRAKLSQSQSAPLTSSQQTRAPASSRYKIEVAD
jgi:hypothetical protein